MSIETLRSVLSSSSEYVDLWKFGWGTAYVSTATTDKVELLADAGVRACLGGTLMEIAWVQGKVPHLLDWAEQAGFPLIEVSRGSVAMTLEDKQQLVRTVARRFTVLAEVGVKDPHRQLATSDWRPEILGDLDAGAAYVIAEGRQSGTVGIYDGQGGVREEVVDAIVDACGREKVIFESPRTNQQAWFIRSLGPQVNLGNVGVDDVTGLETLRLGLRSDTIALSLPLVAGKARAE